MTKPIDYGNLGDEALMQLFKSNRDEHAYKRIYEAYYSPLYKFIYWMAGEESMAQDIAQEALIKVYQKPELFNAQSSFKTWLYTIAKNTLKNAYRKESNETKMKNTLKVVSFESEHETNDELRTQRLNTINQAVQQLPPKQKEVFIMKYSSNLTLLEISEICDCSVGTIKSRLFKATRSIKERTISFR